MQDSSAFKLYIEVMNYSNYVSEYILPTITNANRDLSIQLLDEIYNLKKYLIEAQCTKGNIRVKNITEMIITIYMLDTLNTEVLDFCPKSRNQMTSVLKMLSKIKNMTYGWKNNLESNGIVR